MIAITTPIPEGIDNDGKLWTAMEELMGWRVAMLWQKQKAKRYIP